MPAPAAARFGGTSVPTCRPAHRLAAAAAATSASASFTSGPGSATFRPRSSSSPLRAALAAAGPAGLVAMALSNALFYTVAFTLAARALPRPPPGGGWGPALAAVVRAWGVAYGSGLATKAPRSAAILALMPLVGRALGAATGGQHGRAAKLGAGIALGCLGCVLVTLGGAAVAWL